MPNQNGFWLCFGGVHVCVYVIKSLYRRFSLYKRVVLQKCVYVCVSEQVYIKLRRARRYSRIWNESGNISTSLHVNTKEHCVSVRVILCVHLSCCPSERMSSFLPLICLFVPQKTTGPRFASSTVSDELIKTFPSLSFSLSLSSFKHLSTFLLSPHLPLPLPYFFLLMCDSSIVSQSFWKFPRSCVCLPNRRCSHSFLFISPPSNSCLLSGFFSLFSKRF